MYICQPQKALFFRAVLDHSKAERKVQRFLTCPLPSGMYSLLHWQHPCQCKLRNLHRRTLLTKVHSVPVTQSPSPTGVHSRCCSLLKLVKFSRYKDKLDGRMGRQDVVRMCSGMLLSHREEHSWVIGRDVDGARGCHAERSKSERQKQISYINACMWNLEKWYR